MGTGFHLDDAYPSDPNESYDSDGDGVGDNADPMTIAAKMLLIVARASILETD